MAEKTKRAPKFNIPKKGDKCSKVVRTKGDFHKGSFRWVPVANKGSGRAVVMVGCPIKSRTKAMPRTERRATHWDPKAPIGHQCTFVSTGQKAGLVAHMVVQPRSGGSCRTGYSRE